MDHPPLSSSDGRSAGRFQSFVVNSSECPAGLLRVETLSSSTPESSNSMAGCGLLGRSTSLPERAHDSLNDGMPSSRLLRPRSGTGVEIDDSLFARLLRLGAAIGILERVPVLRREYLVDISVFWFLYVSCFSNGNVFTGANRGGPNQRWAIRIVLGRC